MTEYWRAIERRLHEESALHYPRNKMRLILKAYIDGTLNKFDADDRKFFEQGFLLTCSGEYLDLRGAEMGIPRKEGKIATGTVTFKLTNGAVSRISIPKGTIVSSYVTGYEYVTKNRAYIEVGETSVTVNVQAITYGKKYNCSKNEITYVETESIPSTVAVINETACTGGEDGESDGEYRQRLFNFISTNLSVNFLKKQGIIIYSKKKYDDEIRTKMSSLNPYMSNQYCAIPPNDTIMKYVEKDIIYYKIMQIYIKGW